MAGRKGLAIIIQSGAFERVHYALVLAAAAAAIDRTVTLFFTMDGCGALRPPERLGAWVAQEEALARKGLARLEELLRSCAELGAAITVCEMGLKALDLAASDLRQDLPITVTGAVSFLKAAGADAQMVFV